MVRQNYTQTDIKMALVQALRTIPMDRKAIKDFLSIQYQLYGKGRKNKSSIYEYQVSDKTVGRMIKSIKLFISRLDLGELKHNGDYYELRLCGFPDTITEQDLQSVDLAAKNAIKDKTLNENLQKLKSKLSSKLERVRSKNEVDELKEKFQSTDFFVLGPHATIDNNPEVMKTLRTAIYHQHKVRMSYNKKTKKTTGVFCPLGFVHSPNNQYLVAFPDTGEEFNVKNIKTYILSNISNVKNLHEWFARANSFQMDEYANSIFAIPHDEKTEKFHHFELWVSPEIKKSVDRYTFHPKEEKIYNTDNSLTIKFYTNNAEAVAKYIFQWGGGIVPIAPKELVDEYRSLLKKCLKTVDK